MIFYIALEDNELCRVAKTQEEARAINKNFKKIDVPTDKDGLADMLQDFFVQLHTLGSQITTESEKPRTEETTPMVVVPSYTDRSIQIDEIFAGLSLSHQLSLAQIALENARSQIKPLKVESANAKPATSGT